MKRKTQALLTRALNSLVLGVELFNRPQDEGRVEAVLLMLHHSFEMLLKAVVFEKTGRIRTRREKHNYTIDRCINICRDELKVVDKDQAIVVRNLSGFRDAAMHDTVELGEELLYAHAQSAVAIFTKVLSTVFGKSVKRALPRRVLPLSTIPPKDIQIVISEDMEHIRGLLKSGVRARHVAEARLRPYLVMEQVLRETEQTGTRPASPARLVKEVKGGQWAAVLPLVSGVVTNPDSAVAISLRVSKTEGIPVRIDKSAPTAIAFKYAKVEDRYPHLTTDLAAKLGLTTNKLVGLTKVLGLRGDDEYHTSIRVSRSSFVQRYSTKALEVLRNAIARDGINELWKAYQRGERRDPKSYPQAGETLPPALPTAATDPSGPG